MEDVLAVYQRPYDPRYPVVCYDEKGKELHAPFPGRDPLPPQPNTPQAGQVRQDYEYQRAGSANLFLFCEPLRGWRRVAVTPQRTAQSFARQLQQLVDEDYPQAEKIVLVGDNLNIHGKWSLYDEFDPAEAWRIIQKLEWHATPEHGSWLNMAEIELSAMGRQCLDQRFADADALSQESTAWTQERNDRAVKILWQFTAADARIRLRRLYPIIDTKT